FFAHTRPTARHTLFPYTTLFRSDRRDLNKDRVDRNADQRDINRDKAQLARDDKKYGVSSAQAQSDRKDLRADRVDRNKDQRDIKDRKSTRLNSSHVSISYAVFCL